MAALFRFISSPTKLTDPQGNANVLEPGHHQIRSLCPKCQGAYPIVQGSSQYSIEGRAVALDGMKTACGASLIASQQEFLASE
ncbi:PAAR domain-containing protein [Burkholderia contaminans]|uniref:PAAR domain-containing protein n=1 Tax=Burkholderia contaminans TaxID=488447 RepID=A0A3N8NQ85_9BURK|nr:PAAR domain-containing protein [Burkholderia contaminans]